MAARENIYLLLFIFFFCFLQLFYSTTVSSSQKEEFRKRKKYGYIGAARYSSRHVNLDQSSDSPKSKAKQDRKR